MIIVHILGGFIGIMEKEIDSTLYMIIGYILGLYRDNGKGNGNYSLGFRIEGLCRVHIGITENGNY